MPDKRCVVKVGGSFQSSLSILEEVCEVLSKLSKDNIFLVVPGGGKFADLVRELQPEHGISEGASHRMALSAMGVYGYLLDDLLEGFSRFYDMEESFDSCGIFFPSEDLIESDLEESWGFTSDSVAAWLCGELGFDEIMLVKRVDGIHDRSGFRESISTEELREIDQTVVDRKLPGVLDSYRKDCTIVNGEYPARIESSFEGDFEKCTRIHPEV